VTNFLYDLPFGKGKVHGSDATGSELSSADGDEPVSPTGLGLPWPPQFVYCGSDQLCAFAVRQASGSFREGPKRTRTGTLAWFNSGLYSIPARTDPTKTCTPTDLAYIFMVTVNLTNNALKSERP